MLILSINYCNNGSPKFYAFAGSLAWRHWIFPFLGLHLFQLIPPGNLDGKNDKLLPKLKLVGVTTGSLTAIVKFVSRSII